MPETTTRVVQVVLEAKKRGDPARPFRELEGAAKAAGKSVQDAAREDSTANKARANSTALKEVARTGEQVRTSLAKMYEGFKTESSEAKDRVEKLSQSLRALNITTRDARQLAQQMGKEFQLSAEQVNQAMRKAGLGGDPFRRLGGLSAVDLQRIRGGAAAGEGGLGGAGGFAAGLGLGKMGGRLGLLALGAGAVGLAGTGLGASYARQEGTPLQRSDLDPVSGLLSRAYDVTTGRDIRQRALDDRLARREAAAAAEDQRRAIREDARAQREALQRLNVTSPDIIGIRAQEEIATLERQRRGYAGQVPGLSERFYQGMTDTALLRQRFNQGENVTERLAGSQIRTEQTGQELKTNYQRQNELLREQLQLQRGILQSQVGRVASLRDEFALLDPLQRDRAKDLAAKLKAGGQLERGEYEEALALPGLRDMILRRQRDIDQQSGAFNQFFRNVARPEDLPFLNRAEATNVRIEVVINEDSLARKFAEAIGLGIDRISILNRNLVNQAESREQTERLRQNYRDALFQGPR